MMIFLVGAAASVKAANLAFETNLDSVKVIYEPSDYLKKALNEHFSDY
jgi:hypothetical protein